MDKKAVFELLALEGIQINSKTKERINSFSDINTIETYNDKKIIMQKTENAFLVLTIDRDGSSAFGIYIDLN